MKSYEERFDEFKKDMSEYGDFSEEELKELFEEEMQVDLMDCM